MLKMMSIEHGTSIGSAISTSPALFAAAAASFAVVSAFFAVSTAAVAAAKALPAVEEATTGPQGLTISTADGAGLVAEVAVAFSRQGISPQSLTVRTPSLDDVFLRATGHRLSHEVDE